MSHMSQRARRAFDRVREQNRLLASTLIVAGEIVREQRRTHEEDLGRMAELVCQLLEADALNEELRASLARMTGRYAEALREEERLRVELAESETVDDDDWTERTQSADEAEFDGEPAVSR